MKASYLDIRIGKTNIRIGWNDIWQGHLDIRMSNLNIQISKTNIRIGWNDIWESHLDIRIGRLDILEERKKIQTKPTESRFKVKVAKSSLQGDDVWGDGLIFGRKIKF